MVIMSKKNHNVYVTKPSLPPLEELIPYLKSIWDSKILTNRGPNHEIFEQKISEYLKVEHVSLFSNATIALITSLKALKIQGEIITSPFSFVATSNAIKWSGNDPVFVDIDPKTLNIDPEQIEKAITSKTKAIMPIHCYGNPCDIEKINLIAKKNNLKIIYDAAHAFGVSSKNESILNYGDFSILSFHATKVFNTFEGGAVISRSREMKQYIDVLKNFGFTNETTVVANGINGKMDEFNAALGILQLKYIDENIKKRRKIAYLYDEKLEANKNIKRVSFSEGYNNNYSYYPIIVGENYFLSRDDLYEKLKTLGFFSRRYFYPLISNLPIYKDLASSKKSNLPIANKISNQILCLPIWPDIEIKAIEEICEVINAH
jgi:dTDP-4-amino-4,6-dideoxygalactose transaminase